MMDRRKMEKFMRGKDLDCRKEGKRWRKKKE